MAEDLLGEAQAAYDRAELPEALALIERALKGRLTQEDPAQSNDAWMEEALELKGELLAESGELDAAEKFYKECALRFPTFVGLRFARAQLLSDKAALAVYREGLAICEGICKGGEAADPLLKERMVEALCGMVEIYLTDCCFEPEAESEAQALLERALQVSPGATQPLQLLASVRLSQNKEEEAIQHLEASLANWYIPSTSETHDDHDTQESEEDTKTKQKKKRTNGKKKEEMSTNGELTKQRAEEPIISLNLPPFELRLACARLCMEVGKYVVAMDILYQLQMENDEVIDLWYLCGWCHQCMLDTVLAAAPERVGDADLDELKDSAKRCLQTAWELYQVQGSPDVDMISHIKELLQPLQDDEENEEMGKTEVMDESHSMDED